MGIQTIEAQRVIDARAQGQLESLRHVQSVLEALRRLG